MPIIPHPDRERHAVSVARAGSARRRTCVERATIPASIAAISIVVVSLALLEAPVALVSIALGLAMLAVAVSDMRSFIIPDAISLPAIPAGLLAAGWMHTDGAPAHATLLHLLAAATGAAVLYAIRRLYAALRDREGLGLGDVKLAAVAGAWTGLDGLGPSILVACLLAFVSLLPAVMRRPRRIRATSVLPFGAFLAPSIWLIWLCQATLPLAPMSFGTGF
jgi:leader peptidase (prepilin peptidase)/N-methyltransferase